jgi:hypothetical protein
MGQDISFPAPLYKLIVSALNSKVHGLPFPAVDPITQVPFSADQIRGDAWLWIAVRTLICEGPTGAALKALITTGEQTPAPQVPAPQTPAPQVLARKKPGPKGKMIEGQTLTEVVYRMHALEHLSNRSIAERIYGEATPQKIARVRALWSNARRRHGGEAVPPKQLDS